MSYKEAVKSAGQKVAYRKVMFGGGEGTMYRMIASLTDMFGVSEKKARKEVARWVARYERSYMA